MSKSELSTMGSASFEQVMNKALLVDSLDTFRMTYPIYFLTSGYFLTDTAKNLLLTQQVDSADYIIELYIQQGRSWIKKAGLKTNDISSISYYPKFQDFNFDGQKDIFIRVSASNAYVMSRGHLITIDPTSNAMTLHPEVREEANLEADSKNKAVVSEEYISCNNPPYPNVCKKSFQWAQNKLVLKGKKCPCK